ncbi:MAG: class I adenylate-forming enzyme family protein [Thermodesulfobacteriota bacterium]
MNLAQVLDQSFQKYAEQTAIIWGERQYRYKEMEKEVKIRARWLQKIGIHKGDRVAFLLPKGLEFIFLNLATVFAGAISVPLNPDYSAEEIQYYLTDAEISLLITDSPRYEKLKFLSKEEMKKTVLLDDSSPNEWEPLLRELQKMAKGLYQIPFLHPAEVVILIYTSGSTGKPKGVMITHQNIISNLLALKETWKWTEKDVILHVLPLFHIHGLILNLYGAFLNGSTIILHEKFDPQKAWWDIEKRKCTFLSAVPTIYNRMLREYKKEKYDLRTMRLFISGAAPLSERIFQNFAEETGFRILDRYGMTETGVISSNPLNPLKRIPLSVGFPLPGVKVRIADEEGNELRNGEVGEVWVKGNNVFKGYWKNHQKSKEAFWGDWFKTGDLGYKDQKDFGRLYLVGRKKELIITGGFNVYPKEVEKVLESHEAVQEAAILGIPDEDFGEKVVAVVAFRQGRRQPSFQELINFCKEHLVSYKCPKEIMLVENLPRNAMGKVLKERLRENFFNSFAGLK